MIIRFDLISLDIKISQCKFNEKQKICIRVSVHGQSQHYQEWKWLVWYDLDTMLIERHTTTSVVFSLKMNSLNIIMRKI